MAEVVTKQVSDRLVKFIHEEMSRKGIPKAGSMISKRQRDGKELGTFVE